MVLEWKWYLLNFCYFLGWYQSVLCFPDILRKDLKALFDHRFLLPILRQIELVLISQASCAFFECHLWLNQFLQNGYLALSAKCLPLQLMHLKEWGHSSPAFILSLRGFVLKFALQHYVRSLWCSTLWEPLHFWHFDPCEWQAKVM